MATNKYKPGQFVWVKGKKCRVTKGSNRAGSICWECPFFSYLCPVFEWCQQNLPNKCYPKLINKR